MISAQLRNIQAYKAPTPKKKSVGVTGNAQAIGFKPPSSPKPPAPTSGGGAAPVPLDPLRPDSIYQTALNNITSGLTGTEAALTQDENALGVDYGVGFDRDAQGQATNFRLDYTNPFSKASLLQKAFQQQQTANKNSYAARGQLYAGSLQNAQNDANTSNQQGKHELLSSFGSNARQIFLSRLNARNQAGGQITDAQADLLSRNIQAGPTPAPAPAAANPLQALIQQYGGENVKLTQNGLFYRRPSDGKWIPAHI